MSRNTKAIVRLTFYFLLVFVPMILLIVAPGRPQREFWRDFSVALGFATMALLGLQFIPPARLPFLAEVFPLDTLYHFHHQLSIFTWVLALAHPVILFLNNPNTLFLLDIFSAPWRAKAAVVALLAMTVLILTSVWRKELRMKYEPWRGTHIVAALLATGLGLYHMFKVDYYMSTPWQQGIWIFEIVLWVVVILYVRLIKPWQMLQRPYKLVDLIEERGDSWSLVLEPDGHEGLTFDAGQVAWLTVQRSPFAIREHPFSFSSSEEHPERLSFTIRELGDFTSQVGTLPLGTPVYLDGPYGTFSLDYYEGCGLVFLAGGIGIAPVMSMLRTLADQNDQRPLLLFYGNYSWESVIFREELAELEKRLNLKLIHVLEKPVAGWEGEAGFITREVLERHLPSEEEYVQCGEWIYFICGPLPMINAVRPQLLDLGVPLKNLHAEEYEMA